MKPSVKRRRPVTFRWLAPVVELLEGRLAPAAHTISAALMEPPVGAAEQSGFLATADQRDLYRIHLDPGDQLRAAVTAQTAGSGLLPVLRVFTELGQELALNNQEGGDPQLTVQVATAGDYFVGVSSAGNAEYNPAVEKSGVAGESTGTYALALSVRPGLPLTSDLAGSSFRLQESTAAWGETLHVSFSINNRGGADAGHFTVQLYLSADPRIDPMMSTPLLATPISRDGLAAGEEWSPDGGVLEVTLPASLGTITSGPVYLGLRITPDDPTRDSGTFDKGGVHRGADWESVTIVREATNQTDLKNIDRGLNTRVTGTLTANQVVQYTFSLPINSSGGQFEAEVRATGNSSVRPRLTLLHIGQEGKTPVVESADTVGAPTATLSQYLSSASGYFLEVSADEPGDYQLITTFTPANSLLQTLPTKDAPGAVAVADFNNDGALDLVAINQGSAGRSFPLDIALGNGDGTFAPTRYPPVSSGIGGAPTALAVADLDDDGRTDIVVANRKNGVIVLLGKGDGTFRDDDSDPPPATFAAGDNPVALAVADLNRDGIPDLVVADSPDDTPDGSVPGAVGVLLGTGGGRFADVVRVEVGAHPHGLKAADLDGDGIPDVVVTTDDGVEMLRGRGDGTRFERSFTLVDRQSPGDVVVVDINRDGIPDLLVANTTGSSIGVFMGTGGGVYGAMTAFAVGNKPLALAVADLNGDGSFDVVISNYDDSTFSYLLGDGAGNFVPHRPVYLPSSSSGLALADVNRDGVPDLIATQTATDIDPGAGVNVLLGNGDGSFQGSPALLLGGTPVAQAVEDFNGDGRPDVALALRDRRTVAVELGNGDGSFSPAVPVAVGLRPVAIATADLNNDGRSDLVVTAFGDNTVGVLLGNGDGTFRPEVPYLAGKGPCAVALADVTGDAIPDIVVANNGDGTVGVLLGNGDGTFQWVRAITVGAPSGSTDPLPDLGVISVAVADVDGGGKDIIFADDRNSTVGVLLSNGDGSFRPALTWTVPYAPHAVSAADIDGDGRQDILVVNQGANSVGVLRGNGDGTFQGERSFVVGNGPVSVTAAAINGDGILDLLVANGRGKSIEVLLSTQLPDGTWFFRTASVRVGARPNAVLVRDVNNDQIVDLLVTTAGDRALTALLGLADGSFLPMTSTNNLDAFDAPRVVALTGATDSAGRPILDSVVLDRAGNILFRQGQGSAAQFGPPRMINDLHPARDVIPLQTAGGWVVAAIDRNPVLSGTTASYSIALYTRAPDGTFTRTTPFATTRLPTRIFAADLSGDGRTDDLVIVNALDDSVQVAMQQSDGTFAPLLTLRTGQTPADATFADVNGDGLNDIIVANQSSGDVSVLLNDPPHTFTTSLRLRAAIGPSVFDPYAGELTSGNGPDSFDVPRGDGGPATSAQLVRPTGVAVDRNGNVYIADAAANVVRRVDAVTGVIETWDPLESTCRHASLSIL